MSEEAIDRLPELRDGEVPTQDDSAARRQARNLQQRDLSFRRDLEERAVTVWAGQEIAAVDRRLAEADQLMKGSDYAAAEAAYTEVLNDLQGLADRAADELELALESGSRALAEGDAETAREQFEIAGRIDPGNALAERGRSRADTLDEVRGFLGLGMDEERAGRDEAARDHYARAAALDPLSAEAQTALANVEERIGQDRFAHWMSQGLAALKGR